MKTSVVSSKIKSSLIIWLFVAFIIILSAVVSVFNVYFAFQRDPLGAPLSWIVLMFSVLTFLVRQKARKLYGLIEFSLGCIITFHAVTSSLHNYRSVLDLNTRTLINNLNWVATISGVYFIVRAMDNIGKAFKGEKNRKDALNKSIDDDWQSLVEAEAYRLWAKKGRSGTGNSVWKKAERNVGRRKKDVSLANAWLRVFGSE